MKPLDTDKKPAKPAEAAPAAPVVEAKIDFSNVQIEPLFTDLVDFDTFSKSDFRAVKVKECEAVKKSKKLLQFVLDDGTGKDRIILSGIHDYYEPEDLVGKTAIAEAKDILAKKGVTYSNLWFASDSEAGKFTAGLYSFPTTYVVDKNGNIVGQPIVGGITAPDQAKKLNELIDQALASSK